MWLVAIVIILVAFAMYAVMSIVIDCVKSKLASRGVRSFFLKHSPRCGKVVGYTRVPCNRCGRSSDRDSFFIELLCIGKDNLKYIAKFKIPFYDYLDAEVGSYEEIYEEWEPCGYSVIGGS
jgi:hypothetical protein